jgi:uncharacterized membrane protein YbhN (UPF0104 family)
VKSDSPRSARKYLLLRVLVTLAIFSAIIWLLPMDEVWEAMTRVGWGRWLLVVCVFGAGHVVAAYKWSQLVRAAGSHLDFRAALSAHMAGLFANIWLPSIVGGDVVRAAWISGHQGIAVPAITGLVDRGLDLLALVMLVACGALLVGDSGSTLAVPVLRGSGVLLVVGIITSLITLRWLQPKHLPSAIRDQGMKIVSIIRTLYTRPGPALWSLLLALVVQSSFVSLNFFLGGAMGISIPFAVWLIAWPLAKIVALLPVSLGGLGVREAALATFLAPFAVTGTLAIAEALVWQSILFAFGLLAGLGLLLSGQKPTQPDKS